MVIPPNPIPNAGDINDALYRIQYVTGIRPGIADEVDITTDQAQLALIAYAKAAAALLSGLEDELTEIFIEGVRQEVQEFRSNAPSTDLNTRVLTGQLN